MTIKKKLFILSMILIGILILLFFFYQKGLEKQKQLESLHILTKEEKDAEDDTEPTEGQEPLEEPESTEDDMVKEFIIDRFETVIGYFKHHVTIFAIGDSLTEGVGDETDNEGYVGILQDMINADSQLAQFINHGKRGNRTDQLLVRLSEDPIQKDLEKADIVLITIGANDIMQVFKENLTNLSLEPFEREKKQYEQRLKDIFSEIHSSNKDAQIYLIGFYNPFKHIFDDIEELEMIVNEWNEAGKQIAQKTENTTFIPIKDLFEQADTHYFSDDNFHPNYLGYQLMADRILEYITKEDDDDND